MIKIISNKNYIKTKIIHSKVLFLVKIKINLPLTENVKYHTQTKMCYMLDYCFYKLQKIKLLCSNNFPEIERKYLLFNADAL